jgi:dinuclear metal center YbgI/SA1388 family protein
VQLSELVRYLDAHLRIAEIADYPNALNGLQVDGPPDVTRVATAVDLCRATVEMAAAERVNLLLVHHGLFWNWPRPIVGPTYDRVKGLIEHGIALYSAHLPLDLHPEVGNSHLLARQLEIPVRGGFGDLLGETIGIWGELDVTRDQLATRIGALLHVTPQLLVCGPARVRRIGIVTGAGGSLIGQAAAAGIDTLVTGEGAHHTFFDAEELGVNVIYAGHYATETVGVRALGEHLAAQFHLAATFLDHPTGL